LGEKNAWVYGKVSARSPVPSTTCAYLANLQRVVEFRRLSDPALNPDIAKRISASVETNHLVPGAGQIRCHVEAHRSKDDDGNALRVGKVIHR
jgi:hypothetical protein